nr:ArsC/Spx/MgsR family protein [Pseudomonas aeruginosa]
MGNLLGGGRIVQRGPEHSESTGKDALQRAESTCSTCALSVPGQGNSPAPCPPARPRLSAVTPLPSAVAPRPHRGGTTWHNPAITFRRPIGRAREDPGLGRSNDEHLQRWCAEHGWQTVLNRAGTTFRKLDEAQKADLDEAKAIELMLAQPSMIKRPVLELGSRTLVGFKPDAYAAALA